MYYEVDGFLYRNKDPFYLDCEQSLVFLCEVTARENQARSGEAVIADINSWFAIALAEIRSRRVLRENADCKQSAFIIIIPLQ